MAKKQLISTAFDELNQDLNKEEAYFLGKIVTSEWVSKTGIYKLYAMMLAGTLGFSKFLSSKEIENIAFSFEYLVESDEQKYKRTVMKQMQMIATDRLEDMFDILQRKGKLKYDYEKNLIYVKNFHKYVPFGSAKPSIIFAGIVGGMEKNLSHLFWEEYLAENKNDIKSFLRTAEASANNSKKPELTLLDPNFLTLKKLVF